jgi:integrase
MGVYLRDERWMVFYHDYSGKRKDKSFGRGEQAHNLAEAFDAAVKSAKAAGTEIPDVTIFKKQMQAQVQPVMTFQVAANNAEQSMVRFKDLAEKHLEHLAASGRTERHIHNVSVLLKNQFNPLIGEKIVDQMSYHGDMLPFIRHFQLNSPVTGKPRSQHTVNRYCDYIDSIFNFGLEMGLTTVNPLKGRKKAKETPRDVQLTLEDVKKIMDEAEPHLRWAMEVCFNLGTRPGPSELLSLKWVNLDLEKGNAQIYATKTKQFRTVPINPGFIARLREMKQIAKSEYVVEYKGRKLTTMRKAFNNACERAGINYSARMYDLRHLFATTLLSRGADLAAVSKMMGHSTVKMTADTYYHYLQGEKERAVSLIPSLS